MNIPLADYIDNRAAEEAISRFEAAEIVRDAAQAIMNEQRPLHIEELRRRRDAAKAEARKQAEEVTATEQALVELGAPGRPRKARKARKAKKEEVPA